MAIVASLTRCDYFVVMTLSLRDESDKKNLCGTARQRP